MREVQDLVGIAPWTFIAQICNLFIQMYLIKRFLFKPINAVLQKRKEMADAQLTDARKSKEEAEAMKAEYEQNMAQANIAQERKKAVGDLKNEIGSIAMDIAGKVIEREVSEDDHEKLINEFIKNVGEAS